MIKRESDENTTNETEVKDENLWRKPIKLDSFEDEDPLASLYQGREVGKKQETPKRFQKKTRSASRKKGNSQKNDNSGKSRPRNVKSKTKTADKGNIKPQNRTAKSTKLNKEELKELLKIKSDSFEFTDIREILRGKSLDIYAYLRFLAGDEGFCKIKHNDLMRQLDISRPTLFKQTDWLVRLNLIEKHRVPGDHMGTSYTVRLLENAMQVPARLVAQIESYIEAAGKK